MPSDPLRNITIVLVRPQYAGNIGAVCRAMKNMGLTRLNLVSPEQDPLSAEARMMATSAKDILQKAKIFPSLEDALQGFRWIAGTSARKGINRGPFISPREICPEIIQHARSIPVAILFGPEDRGLTNRELDPCHALISIPTHPGLSSLNLAQAVILLSYELYLASLYEIRNEECGMQNEKRIRREEARSSSGLLPLLAEFQKVEKMYAHLEQLLLRIGFLDSNNPKRIMHTLRRIFGRANLCDRDVAILRGIFRQLEWYATHARQKKD
ncbi:MAG TPA: RNA methyltransferase [Thermodesulfobacteriota bacterium]|nr:RNA methyltransferase [Thermodesulfobacteriota bacterium]